MRKKTGSFSLIERVILSAGAMLIFSVYFHLTKCPEGHKGKIELVYSPPFLRVHSATAFELCSPHRHRGRSACTLLQDRGPINHHNLLEGLLSLLEKWYTYSQYNTDKELY